MKTLGFAPFMVGTLPWAGWATGLVWLLVAASAVHWALRLGVHGAPVPSQAETVGLAQALQGDPQRLFGRPAVAAAPAASPARDRFRVLGVAAQAGDGWVLMSVDGKPVRAYRRGALVDAQWQVLSVAQRRIDIGPANGPAAVSLDLQALPVATQGRLADTALSSAPAALSASAALPSLSAPPMPQAGQAPTGGNEPPPEAGNVR